MDLQAVYYGNTIKAYLTALIIITGSFLLLWLIKAIAITALKKQAAKTETTLDDFLVDALEKCVVPALYFFGIYAGLKYLKFEPHVDKGINAGYIAVITFYAISLATRLVSYSMTAYVVKKEKDESKAQEIKGFLFVVNGIIWILGAVLLLDNLGYKVSTIIAGLGIGGIAVALAAQAVLGDLFSYISILFDKPFAVGDTISVGDYTGVVENIGIKTTRIRSVTGEEIVFSNSDLTGSRLRNLKRMNSRRVTLTLGATYNTPKEKLEKIPGVVKAIISANKEAEFYAAHFTRFSASSLDFDVIYFIKSADYLKYLDVQQEINLKIVEEFGRLGVEFAYPTTTVFLNK